MPFQCLVCAKQLNEISRTDEGVAYRGKIIGRYRIIVCDACYDTNAAGWAPTLLVPHLTALNLPIPAPNEIGLLPRDGW